MIINWIRKSYRLLNTLLTYNLFPFSLSISVVRWTIFFLSTPSHFLPQFPDEAIFIFSLPKNNCQMKEYVSNS